MRRKIKDDPNCLEIPFKTERHVKVGAPTDFYGDVDKTLIHIDGRTLNSYVLAHPNRWMRNLSYVERTIRYPDSCVEIPTETVLEEYMGLRRLSVQRKFDNAICICNIVEIDGRISLPLWGDYAPIIKED